MRKSSPAVVVFVNGVWVIRHNWKHIATFNTRAEADLALASGNFPSK